MKSLYEESVESLKRLPRQIFKAGAVLGIFVAGSVALNLNKHHFTGAIALGVVGGIGVIIHDETQSRKLSLKEK